MTTADTTPAQTAPASAGPTGVQPANRAQREQLEMLDRLNVIEATCRMGMLADNRDWAALTALLAETVELDYTSLMGGTPVTVTAAQVTDGWAASLNGLQSTQHMISNHQVTLTGQQASCTAYFQATHVLPNPHGDPHWVLGGRYDFQLTRARHDQDGELGWRIAAITMTAIWATGNQRIMDLAAASTAPADGSGSP